MQYVRLAIAYSATHPADVVAATEDTSARKLREMRLALQVDKEFSKDEILDPLPQPRLVRQRRVRHLRRQPGLLR